MLRYSSLKRSVWTKIRGLDHIHMFALEDYCGKLRIMYSNPVVTQSLITVSNIFDRSVLREVCSALVNAAYRHKYIRHAHCVSLESLVYDCGSTIVLPTSTWRYGSAPLCDVQAIALLVKNHQPLNLFEFGTFTGQTSLVLMSNATADSRLWTLDLPQTTRPNAQGINWERDIEAGTIGSAFHKHECSSRINQLYDDSLVFDTKPFKNMMDFVYIDACHDYEHVKSDTEKAIEMCRDDAMIVWHDVNKACPDVMRFIGEVAKTVLVNYVYNTNVAYMKVHKSSR